MLSPFRVARLVAAGEYDRLLNELLMNARPLSLAARLRLSEAGTLPPAALGLTLKRLTELSWRPEPPVEHVGTQLAALQQPDGSFGGVAATACALAGINALLHQIAALPGFKVGMTFIDPDLLSRLRASADAATSWIAAHARATRTDAARHLTDDVGRSASPHAGTPGDTHDTHARPLSMGDRVDTAIVIWLLSADAQTWRALSPRTPADSVDALGLRHHRDTAPLVAAVAPAQSPRAGQTASGHASPRERSRRRAA